MKIKCSFIVLTIFVNIFIVVVSDDLNAEESTTSFNEIQAEENVYNISACDAVYIEKHLELKSPNYPENYPPNLECNYLLEGPQCATYYKFEFIDFDVEESKDCEKDRLKIEDQDALCGNKNKIKEYFAPNGSLHIKFQTDGYNSGKGYHILVTRESCDERQEDSETEEITTEFLLETTTEEISDTTSPLLESRIFPTIIQEDPQCCSNNFNTKTFILTSPNFPYSLNRKTDCIYKISKANNNICRLKLNFKFFWLGFANQQNYCPHGFLEVDGKYICGCNTAVQLTTTFGNSDTKILKFKTDGFYQNFNTGFVVEVIQEECPIKYSPAYYNQHSNYSDDFQYYDDHKDRIAWPGDIFQSFIKKLQLINERTEILDDEDVYLQDKPKIVKSVYIFAAPEYNDIPSLFRDTEKTTYVDSSSINSILTNSNYEACLNWNQIQYNNLQANYGTSLQTCKRQGSSEMNVHHKGDCVELDHLKGYFRSPGYPCYYPGNLDVCYRFKKQPGYCKIRILMNDFQLEDSVGCKKDYVVMADGHKYCGYSLFKASWTIDLQSKDYEDIKFVTDAYYCGRGFSGVFQQILCQDTTFPINPTYPSIPHSPPTTLTPIYCDRLITEKSFTIELKQIYRKCTFRIKKSSKDVCKVNLYFEKFDISCKGVSLTIDGTTYCGNLTGRGVTLNLYDDPKNLIYRSVLGNKHDADELKIKIRGEQLSDADDCSYIPPAERLLSLKSDDSQKIQIAKNVGDDHLNIQNNSKYLVALLTKNFKDICGIVTNTTERELPTTFCDILINEHNATRCAPLKENVKDVPYKPKKPEQKLLLQNVKIIEDVEFNEIDCDKL